MSQKEDNAETQENFLRVLSNQISRKILSSIQRIPKSAIQISIEQNIELTKVYRRLQHLQSCGMLEVSFQVTSEGKKSYYYKSKIEGINVKYRKDEIKVNLIFNSS